MTRQVPAPEASPESCGAEPFGCRKNRAGPRIRCHDAGGDVVGNRVRNVDLAARLRAVTVDGNAVVEAEGERPLLFASRTRSN